MMSDEELLSLAQASRRTGVSTSRLRRLAANSTLRARKAGTYWVVSASALDEFIHLARPRGVKAAARSKAARS